MCCHKYYRAEHHYGDCQNWGLCDPCKEQNKGEDNRYVYYMDSLDEFDKLVDLFDTKRKKSNKIDGLDKN